MSKNWGIGSLVQGLASGPADEQTVQYRTAVCRQCQGADSKGERLFRVVAIPGAGNMAFCGAPRWKGMYRDEQADGCGCVLKVKLATKTAMCPRGMW